MKMFSANHVATLFRYMGTSFVAGAVAHGAFSEARSLGTAFIGVVAYVIGSVMQARLESIRQRSWGPIIIAGAVAAVGIGFFTGGLQHFPDSPNRSVWVVPLGFLLSGLGLHFLAHAEDSQVRAHGKKVYAYLLAGLAVVTCLSVVAQKYFENQDGHGHHDHGGHHGDHHDGDEGDGHDGI